MKPGSDAYPTVKPRVLWVSYTGNWVGPTNSLSLLLEHLQDRFDSTVLSTGEGDFTDLLEERGIPHFVIPVMGRRKLLAVTRHIRAGGYDLVYGNCTSGPSATAALASRLNGVPFICHVRSKWDRGRGIERHLFRLSNDQIAVSRAAATAFASFVKGTRPKVVYNGVALDRELPAHRPARAALLTELGLGDDAVLLLSVGHVMTRKSQLDAVAAMEKVVETAPNAILLLVGRLDRDPEYVRELEAKIAAAGLERNVRFLGFRRDIDALTAASDVQVHTARIDPHPRAVLEGMLGGLPTVAYAVDGVAETVVHGETGALVEAGDVETLARELAELATDPAARNRMGAAARRLVERRFDAADTARQVGDIIEETLGKRIGGAVIDARPGLQAR